MVSSAAYDTLVLPMIGLGNMVFGVSNRLDPDEALHFVRPDLDPNFLQRFSADKKKSPLAGKELMTIILDTFPQGFS